MIRHIVMLAFAKGVEEAKIIQCLKKLGELRSYEVPEIISFSFGQNISKEQLDKGFNYVFMMEFLNYSDLEKYLNNQAHKSIAHNELIPLLAEGINSLIVMDYEIK